MNPKIHKFLFILSLLFVPKFVYASGGHGEGGIMLVSILGTIIVIFLWICIFHYKLLRKENIDPGILMLLAIIFRSSIVLIVISVFSMLGNFLMGVILAFTSID